MSRRGPEGSPQQGYPSSGRFLKISLRTYCIKFLKMTFSWIPLLWIPLLWIPLWVPLEHCLALCWDPHPLHFEVHHSLQKRVLSPSKLAATVTGRLSLAPRETCFAEVQPHLARVHEALRCLPQTTFAIPCGPKLYDLFGGAGISRICNAFFT